jgi:hypothetical protein
VYASVAPSNSTTRVAMLTGCASAPMF